MNVVVWLVEGGCRLKLDIVPTDLPVETLEGCPPPPPPPPHTPLPTRPLPTYVPGHTRYLGTSRPS